MVTIVAHPNNKITYCQDMGTHTGLPANIYFNVVQLKYEKEKLKCLILEAPGYGVLGKGDLYGNGKIYLYLSFLSEADRNKILNFMEKNNDALPKVQT